MKLNKTLLPIFLSMALLAGICIGVFFDFPAQTLALSESSERENKLRQIINYIDYEYVDALNTDSLLDIAIIDLLHKLDPHSTYIPKTEVAASEEHVRGSFDGIGIEFKVYRDTLTVVRAIEGGPSKEAGIRAGDRILAAQEQKMHGSEITAADVINTLKGEAGTAVSLEIYRPQDGSKKMINLERGAIPMKSVQSSFMTDEKTGYINLIRFSQNSDLELEAAIKKLKKQGALRMILDLRDNPGGLLTVARDVADEFLGEDDLIVFTKDRGGDKNSIYATDEGLFEKGKLAVLINEGSASASEIVAGAIQDNDRGWVIGRRSFGKGLVQEEMTLKDGSRIRLTTRRYYTPSGRSIQKPYQEYDPEFMIQHGYEGAVEGIINDTIMGKDVYKTSGGRKVYGGGGINPDITVGIDTSRAGVVLYHLANVSRLDERAFSYVDENRAQLIAKGRERFIHDFEVTDDILFYFFSENAVRLEAEGKTIMDLVKARIKAYIAYNLYGSSAFQEVYFPHDPVIIRAMESLDNEILAQKKSRASK